MATEWVIADELKKQCFPNGRERNPRESAKTIHKLGLLYSKKRPEKISLIQSAVLLNAALVRQPENEAIVKQDLEFLISDVLLRANATRKDADLIKFSASIRNELRDFREKVRNDLILLKPSEEGSLAEEQETERTSKISLVKRIQHFISERYVSIMRKISDYCVDVMGQPPCRYVLVGMGSLAHEEVTPYSDFESAIVLEEGVDDNVVEYFRWCSVLFQLVLACLQETIIRFIAIESLNDPSRPGGNWFYDAYTPCGVCSDGFAPQAGKHPLGRQKPTEKKPWTTELIKSVSEMVKYLESDEDLRNGYHLADVLSKTCFVAGDSALYDQFCIKSQAQLDSNGITYKNKLLNEIADSLKKFNALELLAKSHSDRLDVKRLLYRTSTIFVSSLGKFFDVRCKSNFEILDEFVLKGVMTLEESNLLKYAVAISCEIRLKMYMKTKGQNDIFKNSWVDKNEAAEIVHALGKTCIFEYFRIIRCFSKYLMKLRNHNEADSKKMDVDFKFADPLLCAIVCSSLSMVEEVVPLLEKALKYSGTNAEYAEKQRTFDIMNLLCTHLLWQKRYTDARYYIEKAIEAKCGMLGGIEVDEGFFRSKSNLGHCLFHLGDVRGALKIYQEILDLRLNTSSNPEADLGIADCRRSIGMCVSAQNNFENAIEQYQQELSIRQAVTNDDSVCGPCCQMLKTGNQDVIECLLFTAQSMAASGRSKKALIYLFKGLSFRRQMSDDETTDPLVANFYLQISSCYCLCQKFIFALEYADKKFAINAEKPYSEQEALILQQLGLLSLLGKQFFKAGKYAEALRSFHYELRLHDVSKPCNNSKMAECIYNIGKCHSAAKDREAALGWFQRALDLRRRNFANEATLLDTAIALYSVGGCLYLLRKYNEAVEHFQQFRAMGESIISDPRFANYQQLLILCLILSKNNEQAYAECEQMLRLPLQYASAETRKFYGVGCNFMGTFDKSNGQYEKALQMFQQEKIFLGVLESRTNDTQLAKSLSACNRNIGICFFKLGCYNQALESFQQEMKVLKNS